MDDAHLAQKSRVWHALYLEHEAAFMASVSIPSSGATPAATDFAKALAMIATLPLTDAEKADAVRRLLGAG